jgi:hypothetical protein
MASLLEPTADPTHQADATQRDKAFQEDIRLGKIQILKQEQATSKVVAAVPAATGQEATIKTTAKPLGQSPLITAVIKHQP